MTKPGEMKHAPASSAPARRRNRQPHQIASWVQAGPGNRLHAAIASSNSAVRRDLPLYAVRVEALWPDAKIGRIDAVFAEASGGVPAGLEVHRALLPPPVAATLVECADRPGGLLVVGASGRGWWRKLWSGSIAHTCVRKARCPLLIVLAPPLARAVPQHRWIRTPHDVWRRFEQETTSARG